MKENLVLFLGNAETEGVTSKLTASNSFYKRKMLESSLQNWESIIQTFDSFNVTSVIAKLTNATFETLSSEIYQDHVSILFPKIAAVPNLIMTHISLITGRLSKDEMRENPYLFGNKVELDYYDSYFEPPSDEVRNIVLELFERYHLTITPYRKNVELSVISQSFIEQNESDLIFRIYVPTGRMWVREAEKLLQLFREYLQKVSGLSVRHDQYKTNQGFVYEFFGGDDVSASTLPNKFNEFSNFMDSCISNPENAKLLLESKNLGKKEVLDLVDRYGKEARRLHIDLKHEREKKILSIRHRLESELAEYARTEEDWSVITSIVNSNIPRIDGVSAALSFNQNVLLKESDNLTINVKPQIIETVNGVVSQEITGNQNLGIEAKQLLELIDRYGSNKKTELASSVYELSDKDAKDTDRFAAKHKLLGFVLSASSKIGDVATGVLQSFIENQIGV